MSRMHTHTFTQKRTVNNRNWTMDSVILRQWTRHPLAGFFHSFDYLCSLYLHTWFPYTHTDLNRKGNKHTHSHSHCMHLPQCIIVTCSFSLVFQLAAIAIRFATPDIYDLFSFRLCLLAFALAFALTSHSQLTMSVWQWVQWPDQATHINRPIKYGAYKAHCRPMFWLFRKD